MLDEFLPRYDFNEVHTLSTAAPAAAVMQAIQALTPAEVPLMVALMAVRSVPRLLSRERPSLRGALLDGFLRAGFATLRERPDEVVIGGVGRFWQPTGGLLRDRGGGVQLTSHEPGYAKAGFDFRAGAGRATAPCVLSTETRVAHHRRARLRRRFGLYWRVDPARQRTDPPELAGCHQDARGADSPLAGPPGTRPGRCAPRAAPSSGGSASSRARARRARAPAGPTA